MPGKKLSDKAFNSVFIAASLDGFIAGPNGELDWLNNYPAQGNSDMGYKDFLSDKDAVVMGRNTFETVLAFDIEWPYSLPVFVLSKALTSIPSNLGSKVFLKKGKPENILPDIHSLGYYRLYIDGGNTIQSFLKEDLLDEMIITTIPVILGNGIPLFSSQNTTLKFACTRSIVFPNQVVQNHYIRNRTE